MDRAEIEKELQELMDKATLDEIYDREFRPPFNDNEIEDDPKE